VAAAMARELTIAFVWGYGFWDGRDEYARALDLVAAGRVQLEPAVTHRVALDDLAEGYAVAAGRATSGAIKVLVEP
jgi:threonine dehydrogenase-like Zn-dependent dehydrogenase